MSSPATNMEKLLENRGSGILEGMTSGASVNGGGPSRLLVKLNEAIESKKFYEAHQLMKTINFRLTSAKKFDELELLLYRTSKVLLESNQIESGCDVAIMLSKLYPSSSLEVNDKRILDSINLLEKMPPSTPERLNFISGVAEWAANEEPSGKFHAAIAQMYIKENNYSEAWKHLVRDHDGKHAAYLAQLIMSETFIRPEETDLVIALLVLGFLSSRRVKQAEDAYTGLVTRGHFKSSPLLNGVRFLVEAAKLKSPQAFTTIRETYEPSFSRFPQIRKLVGTAGKALFKLSDRHDRSANSFMAMLQSAFMQPEPDVDQAALD